MFRLMIISFIALLTACGSGDRESTPTFLEGEWIEETCLDLDDELEFEQTTFKFVGNQANVYSHTYDTSDCSGDLIRELSFQGSFEIGEDKVLGTGETITQFVITLDSAIAVANTMTQAEKWSDDAFCGVSDWEQGEPRSIYDCYVSDVGNELKEIALVEGDVLYRGYYDERGEDGYSDVLDLEIPYNKKQ